DRERAYQHPERIALVTKYILDHFDQKTYRRAYERTYGHTVLTNVAEVAESKHRELIEEKKQKQRVSGFNSIFAVSSVQAAKLYYEEFLKQMDAKPEKALKIAVIYSYGANEEDPDGIIDEEDPENTSALDSTARDFLEKAIGDYNRQFNTNYDTSGDKFQSYYKDVSLRMKNKELDLLIVVNMFLTGFDATTLNTLWVDKNLKMHGLIQAFSRTNRILNSIKTFGNIICFRALKKRTDAAIALFGDKAAGGIVTLQSFDDYYNGYEDSKGKHIDGYADMIDRLQTEFPLDEWPIVGEERQKEFIALLGAILRMRNLLQSFDEFEGKEIISERDFQDYLGKYQDLRDEWNERRKKGTLTSIDDDIVFEIELIKQIEINIDYILMLVTQYHDSHGKDKEVLITIRKAVESSSELRSKKDLIENFIAGITEVDDVMNEWHSYVAAEREKELVNLIAEEKLKEAETRAFISNAFRDGGVKTTGTDIDRILPPMPRFGGGSRREKKETVIEKLKAFFERFWNI
ncbi:MAG: type I restriction endonuclease subunit R, partial [Oscillospiraceae bacterium]|nr:type I restriction endonuclease subunit R [Oscillospiraceae bacterium]